MSHLRSAAAVVIASAVAAASVVAAASAVAAEAVTAVAEQEYDYNENDYPFTAIASITSEHNYLLLSKLVVVGGNLPALHIY